MPKRVGVFIDSMNLYHSITRKFSGRRLDYRAYMNFITPFGDIVLSTVYGAQVGNEAVGFIYFLKAIGFKVKYKAPKTYYKDGILYRKVDWDVGITVDMLDLVRSESVDLIVLGSADGDMTPAVQWIQKQGVRCVVVACGVNRDLKKAAYDCIEIYDSLLEKS